MFGVLITAASFLSATKGWMGWPAYAWLNVSATAAKAAVWRRLNIWAGPVTISGPFSPTIPAVPRRITPPVSNSPAAFMPAFNNLSSGQEIKRKS
ncbi:hypothetical protein BBD39_08195 [Arsenophonus endosymbiont of Bemisia tabaci Asia II 3]|nr:hypothetical protein BBD39_08195 [Arsenophonus endosymbiont of Bemisia tabaci Asia II 3]